MSGALGRRPWHDPDDAAERPTWAIHPEAVAGSLAYFVRSLHAAGIDPAIIHAELATALVRSLADDPRGAERVHGLALAIPELYEALVTNKASRSPRERDPGSAGA